MTATELAELIGKRVQHARLNQEMSRSALAFATGLSTSYVSLIERGERLPHLDVLFRMSEALSIPIFLFFADEKSLNDVGVDLELIQLLKPVSEVVRKLGLRQSQMLLSARVVWALHAPKGLEGKPPV